MTDGETYSECKERRVSQVTEWVPLEKEEIEERVDEKVSLMEDNRDDVDDEMRKTMVALELGIILGEFDELPSQDEFGAFEVERQMEKYE